MKKTVTSLNDMQIGEKVIVKEIKTKGSIRRRLLDIGLIEDTIVECVLKSPFGDPKAYLIRGAVIALRSEEANTILVQALS